MGLIPPFWTMFKKTAQLVRDGFPYGLNTLGPLCLWQCLISFRLVLALTMAMVVFFFVKVDLPKDEERLPFREPFQSALCISWNFFTCIDYEFGHLVAQHASVAKLATRWRHLDQIHLPLAISYKGKITLYCNRKVWFLIFYQFLIKISILQLCDLGTFCT